MAYGESTYGTHQYGEETKNSDGQNITPPDLMAYLPAYYRDSRVVRAIQNALAEEIGNLRYAQDDVLRQFFVYTATWGLDLWEKILDLPVDTTRPAERRREIIIAKLRGAGTTTKQMIINAAAAFSGGEVDVIEYPAEYRFVVKFIGVKGIPPNMAGFIAMLEQIKPAHLTYSFEYTYTVWDNLRVLAWSQAGTRTWNELKVYEGA